MTALQKLAVGVFFLFIQATTAAGWDLYADPLGWLFILWGVHEGRDHLAKASLMRGTAYASLAVSVLTYPPAVTRDLDAAASWLLTLPQTAFYVVLCAGLAETFGGRDGRWWRWLMWLIVAVSVAVGAVVGAEDDPTAWQQALIEAATVGTFLAQVGLFLLLLANSYRPETGAVPRARRPRRGPGVARSDEAGTDSGQDEGGNG